MVGAKTAALQQFGQYRRHLPNGELVHLLAVHLDRAEAPHLGAEAPQQGLVPVDLGKGEAAVAAAIGAHPEGHQAILLGRAGLQGHRARPIAEQHAGASVIPVEPAAELVGADDQHPLHGAAAQVLGGGDQGEEKATAGCGEIEGHGVGGAEGRLHLGGRSEEVVWARGGQQDHVEVGRPPARLL